MKKVSKGTILDEVKHDEYIVVDPKGEVIVVYDGEKCEKHNMQVIKRLYKKIPGSDLMEEINVAEVVNKLADALIGSVDVKELLVRSLQEMPPPNLLKVKEIAELYPEAIKAAKPREGCFFLDIEDPRPGHESQPIFLRN